MTRTTAEAVEAAARSLHTAAWRDGDWSWGRYPEGGNPWITRARAALSAALPYLQAVRYSVCEKCAAEDFACVECGEVTVFPEGATCGHQLVPHEDSMPCVVAAGVDHSRHIDAQGGYWGECTGPDPMDGAS